ncbi:unnamed protein product, partial [Iphiclides podalirius]
MDMIDIEIRLHLRYATLLRSRHVYGVARSDWRAIKFTIHPQPIGHIEDVCVVQTFGIDSIMLLQVSGDSADCCSPHLIRND